MNELINIAVLRQLKLFVAAVFLLQSSTMVTYACSIRYVSPFEEAMRMLFENKRVRQYPDCSFVNGGSSDQLNGAPSIDLGQGRVGQIINDDSAMIVTVCAEHQVVILFGKPVGDSVEGVCGGLYQNYDTSGFDPASGKFDFHAGSDFAGFMRYAEEVDMARTESLNDFLDMEHAKDRINLLCGCEVFYPATVRK